MSRCLWVSFPTGTPFSPVASQRPWRRRWLWPSGAGDPYESKIHRSKWCLEMSLFKIGVEQILYYKYRVWRVLNVEFEKVLKLKLQPGSMGYPESYVTVTVIRSPSVLEAPQLQAWLGSMKMSGAPLGTRYSGLQSWYCMVWWYCSKHEASRMRFFFILNFGVFSRKTFRRRVLQKMLAYLTPHISHTYLTPHISHTYPSHHTYPTHIHSKRIHSKRIPPIRIPPIRIRSARIPPVRIHAMRIHSKRLHQQVLQYVSHQYISHQYVSSTRIPPVRIHSMRIHSKSLHQQEWQWVWVSLHIISYHATRREW